MRNTLNDVISLVENVIVTGKNRDWEKVVETANILKGDIYGVSGMVTERGWNNVYSKMLGALSVVKEYDCCYNGLDDDESYIIYLQKLMGELKVLNEIRNMRIWA